MATSIQQQVDRLIDERPGKELLTPAYDDAAHPVASDPPIYRSGGTTASYCMLTETSRVIVNTGMGFEAPHHKRLFDAVRAGPTPYIITTQAHVDHVGGVQLFRAPGTVYVAQANNPACQADDARIQELRIRTASIWFDISGTVARRIHAENPGVPMVQDRPAPDLMFTDRLALTIDGLRVELIAATGETTDSLIVWLPDARTALISNLLGPLFPHFPNLNTIRGDKYRFVEPYLRSVRTLRELQPERLITGRHEPIIGAGLIDASLERLHDAVDWVHRETLAGMNAGVDVWTLMRDIKLPAHLRVGQGYGKVPWAVRTIWESYVGWFKLQSTTELHPDEHRAAIAELVDAAGTDVTLERARRALDRGDAVVALHLAEAVLACAGADGDVDDARAANALLLDAHHFLLEHGGDVSFWEDGWLRHQIARFEAG
jgi:glyoxylase-like metal-dependent hydrolase (beta-lactamase superfamily II)